MPTDIHTAAPTSSNGANEGVDHNAAASANLVESSSNSAAGQLSASSEDPEDCECGNCKKEFLGYRDSSNQQLPTICPQCCEASSSNSSNSVGTRETEKDEQEQVKARVPIQSEGVSLSAKDFIEKSQYLEIQSDKLSDVVFLKMTPSVYSQEFLAQLYKQNSANGRFREGVRGTIQAQTTRKGVDPGVVEEKSIMNLHPWIAPFTMSFHSSTNFITVAGFLQNAKNAILPLYFQMDAANPPLKHIRQGKVSFTADLLRYPIRVSEIKQISHVFSTETLREIENCLKDFFKIKDEKEGKN